MAVEDDEIIRHGTPRAATSSVLTGGAGMVTFYSATTDVAPTVAGAMTNVSMGSFATGTLVLTTGNNIDAGRTTIVFGSGHDSVSVGGVTSTIAVTHPSDPVPGRLRIDMNMLHLIGPDSTSPATATDLGAAMHLPGGTRIDMLQVDYIVRSPFA